MLSHPTSMVLWVTSNSWRPVTDGRATTQTDAQCRFTNIFQGYIRVRNLSNNVYFMFRNKKLKLFFSVLLMRKSSLQVEETRTLLHLRVFSNPLRASLAVFEYTANTASWYSVEERRCCNTTDVSLPATTVWGGGYVGSGTFLKNVQLKKCTKITEM